MIGIVLNYGLHALNPDHLREVLAIRKAIDACVRRLVDFGVLRATFGTSNPRMTALALVSLGIDVALLYPRAAVAAV